ncbi:glutathione S-transferase [Annulohypoxylon stygium]|nr:glutathione S-transferase [Annulohypoxylon stygium]
MEELQIPYEVKSIKFDDVKKKPLIDVNPNGRVPAIEDPNTGLTLWESGAIITYLIKQYDTKHAISYDTFPEEHLLNQFLHFQMSGQGPYYGVAGWFIHLHPEKVPSAMDRYTKQVRRVLGVVDGLLEGKQWLVGDKMTYADMAWVPWNDRVDTSLNVPGPNKFDGFPNVKAWHERMISLPSWKRSMELRAKLMDEQGLQWNGIPKGITNFQEYEAKIKAENEANPQ